MITSLQNPRVKDAIALRDSRQRRKRSLFLIDGLREISRALMVGISFESLFLCSKILGKKHDVYREILAKLSASGVEQIEVSTAVFERLAFGDRAEGLVAVARTPQMQLDDLHLPACPLVAVLEGVEKPGNVGAVLRSADGAGVSALIVADGGTDLYNPNTIRASLGTIFSVPTCAADSATARDWLAKQKLKIFTACVDAKLDYTDVDFIGPAAFVLGSEATGLSTAWGEAATAIRLPMRGIADSLNVSAAAAVLFYEALRQRTRRKSNNG